MAERAAVTAFESHERNPSICCGLAGRAYAILSFYRFSSSRKWLSRAREMCDAAAANIASADPPWSLFKGKLGIALLAEELDQPDLARFPLLEPEGWRTE
jgi:serine/threonine-protein kinase